jgi:MerR family mercuric resistance operon transcriptional regulator
MIAVDTLSVSQLARQAGVNVQTIRYYERQGLLPPPPRSAGGYRVFPPQSASRVRFIKHAQSLGFTLKEVKELLDLRLDPATTCAEVRSKARNKIADFDQKIASLGRMKAALARLSAACSGRGTSEQCPILQSLDGEAS